MTRKKLICIGNYLNTSGAPMNAILIASEAQKLGWEAEAWFVAQTGERPPADVPVRVFAAGKPQGAQAWACALAKFCWALARVKADRVISFYPLTNVLGALCGVLNGATFVASQQNPSHAQNGVTKLLDRLLGSTPLYAGNICVSHAVKNSFRSYPQAYQQRLKVVHNAVPPLPTVKDTPTQARKALGLPLQGLLVGSLGRLDPQKNLSFLIRTLALMPEGHLAIAGDGSEREMLQALAKELGLEPRITWLGTLQGEQVSRFYRAIDVFAMPSLYEGFGRTLVEAMMAEVPVVASPLEVLKEVGMGVSVHPEMKEEAWAQALSHTT